MINKPVLSIFVIILSAALLYWLYQFSHLISTPIDLSPRSEPIQSQQLANAQNPLTDSTSPTPLLSPNETHQPIVITNDILECPEQTPHSTNKEPKTFNAHFTQLEHSTINEEQLAYLMFGQHAAPESRFKKLYQYIQRNPTDKIAFYQFINSCHRHIDDPICHDALPTLAEQADPNNGMLWINIAALKIKQQDQKGALLALHSATQKAYFSEYFFDLITLFSENTGYSTPNEYVEVVIAAIGFTAAQPAFYGLLFEQCIQANDDAIDFMDACFQLGKRMSKNSHSVMLSSMGESLVKEHFLKSSNEEAAAESEYGATQIYQVNFNDEAFKALNLIFNDDALVRQWLQIGREQGEAIATKQMIQEAKWRSRDPNYAPCKVQVVQ